MKLASLWDVINTIKNDLRPDLQQMTDSYISSYLFISHLHVCFNQSGTREGSKSTLSFKVRYQDQDQDQDQYFIVKSSVYYDVREKCVMR